MGIVVIDYLVLVLLHILLYNSALFAHILSTVGDANKDMNVVVLDFLARE